jgi:flagellar basal-body rod protein FlgB
MATADFAYLDMGDAAMSGIGLPVISDLKTKLHWLQERQKLLAENVANADTPGYKPKDLRDVSESFDSMTRLATTSGMHLSDDSGSAGTRGAERFETVPSGNAVTLEDEMMKVAETQGDYQAAAELYGRSLSLLKIAVGRK